MVRLLEHDSRSNGTPQIAYTTQLVADIWLLIDYISASKDLSLPKDGFPEPKHPSNTCDLTSVFAELKRVQSTLDKAPPNNELSPEQHAFLQLTKDKLASLVKPVSARTIAYTALVAEGFRQSPGRRARLAIDVMPGFLFLARIHRWNLKLVIPIFGIVLTFLAVWLYTELALGKINMQQIDGLLTKQVQALSERKQLGSLSDNFTEAPISSAKLIEYSSAEIETLGNCNTRAEQELCRREKILQRQLREAEHTMCQWLNDWPILVGGIYRWVDARLPLPDTGASSGGHCPCKIGEACEIDAEFLAAPRVLAIGNFLLPLVFGVLGSLIYVVMEFYTKVRASLLNPGDGALVTIRLVLGLIVGTCVGLFFGSYTPTPHQTMISAAGSDLIASMTLSASGIAFIAGFGVEEVFNLLKVITGRVFATDSKRT